MERHWSFYEETDRSILADPNRVLHRAQQMHMFTRYMAQKRNVIGFCLAPPWKPS
jgi:hypothetical protein